MTADNTVGVALFPSASTQRTASRPVEIPTRSRSSSVTNTAPTRRATTPPVPRVRGQRLDTGRFGIDLDRRETEATIVDPDQRPLRRAR